MYHSLMGKWSRFLPPSLRRRRRARTVRIPTGDLKSLDLAYSEAKEVFQLQLEQIDKLDSKIGFLLGAAGVILAVIVQKSFSEMARLEEAFFLTAACLMALSAFLSLLALWVRKFMIVPDPRALSTGKLIEAEEKETKKVILKNIVRYYEEAQGKGAEKARLTTAAALLLVLGLVCAVGGFAASQTGGGSDEVRSGNGLADWAQERPEW